MWEMLNKGLMRDKPFVALGTFWEPIIERVREVELGQASSWGEQDEPLIGIASSSVEAATRLSAYFQKLTSSSRPDLEDEE